MHRKGKWMVSILLSMSVLCGTLPVSAVETPTVITEEQEVTAGKPAAPSNIQAEALPTGGVRISWDAVSGVAGYRVYRWNGTDWKLLRMVRNANKTNITDFTAELNWEYSYTVRAYSVSGRNIQLSELDEQAVSVKTAATLTQPKLDAVTAGGGGLTVTWDAVSGAQGYVIYRKTSNTAEWTKLTECSGLDSTSYTDMSVAGGATYYYTVAAYSAIDGNLMYSTYDQTGISGKAAAAMTAPKLNGVSMGKKGLVVKWTAVSGADSYVIYRAATTEGWEQIASVAAGTTSYEDTNALIDGTTYTYAVAGCASGAVGAYDNNGISCTYYSYQAALNSGTLPTNFALPNVTKESFGTSGEGRELCAYTVGTGSKHMVLNFAIHGWEDHWSRDGYELVRVAAKVLETLSANAATVTQRGWSVTVIPYANPDGIVSGTTHNGPGRCSTYRYNDSGTLVKGGVDMNRCFPSGFKVYTTARNYTGSQPLMTKEARALRTLVDNKKGSSTNVFIDIHGWTQQILTNTSGSGFVYSTLHSYFPSNSAGGLGGGYISRYAKSVGYNACLFEFPRNVNSHSAMVNAGYDTKFVNAVMSMINNH
ncbi:MAG: M14 family zinc carboxypeptidase [Eubacteriales bacterium]|nr:M14 family zinc carboxypeptidase [Eubacteriales bacterium]